MFKFVILFCLMTILAMASSKMIDGYVVNPDDPEYSYKLVYLSKSWKNAKEWCEEDDGILAVPKTQEQFVFIQKLVRAMHYPSVVGTNYKLLVWLGFNNMDNYKVWINVDGEDIQRSDFHQWAGDNGNTFSDDPVEPHCAGMDAINPGLRDWWCNHRQPFICERRKINTI